MLIDSQETFAEAQAVASVVGDVVSTNVYDTGAAADVGNGENIMLYAKMNTALAGAGSSIQAVLQTSADNSAWVDAGIGPVTALASAVANVELARIKLPLGLRRYLRVAFRTSGATSTGGTASAYLVKDIQAQQYGASGFTVA